MRNDTDVKVTCLTNDNEKDEFHFDYYDKEGNIVGTVAVSENGKLGWAIWNQEYASVILDNVSYIFGAKVDNSMEYISLAKEQVKTRWTRAEDYIMSKGLYVNYLQNDYFKREFDKKR